MTVPHTGRPPDGLAGRHKSVSVIIRSWLPPLIYCILIFMQSAYPSPHGLPEFKNSDKLMHFFGYGILGALACRAVFTTWPKLAFWGIIGAAAGAALLYGISDECHQMFVPGRSPDVFDVAADALGGLVGALSYAGVTQRRTAANCGLTTGLTNQGTSVKKHFGLLSTTDRNSSNR